MSVVCSCGKKLDRVPSWLESVGVTFVCSNCPNRVRTQIPMPYSVAPKSKSKAVSEVKMDSGEESENED